MLKQHQQRNDDPPPSLKASLRTFSNLPSLVGEKKKEGDGNNFRLIFMHIGASPSVMKGNAKLG